MKAYKAHLTTGQDLIFCGVPAGMDAEHARYITPTGKLVINTDNLVYIDSPDTEVSEEEARKYGQLHPTILARAMNNIRTRCLESQVGLDEPEFARDAFQWIIETVYEALNDWEPEGGDVIVSRETLSDIKGVLLKIKNPLVADSVKDNLMAHGVMMVGGILDGDVNK